MVTARLISAPAEEPVTLAEVKSHIREDGSSEDTLLTKLITSARRIAEEYTRRAFVTQTWDLYLDTFPPDYIWVPRPPLQSVPGIVYYDANNVETTWSVSEYQVDTKREPGRIAPKANYVWPATYNEMNAVTVTFVCGYGGAGDVPEDIKHAILQICGHLFSNREVTGYATAQASIPLGPMSILNMYRVGGVFS